MSKVGRKANVVPSVQWLLHIPVTLAARVDLLLKDPVRDKVKYGARGELLTQLLEKWVKGQITDVIQPEWKNNNSEARTVYMVEDAENSPGKVLGIFASELLANTFALDYHSGSLVTACVVQYGQQNEHGTVKLPK